MSKSTAYLVTTGIFTAVATAIWWFMEDDKTTVTVTKESQS
nr:MAG TPA: hypothetical protein [Caudoviricetes sp.]DAK22749.1 MAG TPA: hypothetical protein [Caudoviricetes sp.]DAX41557.1 MAG TPA: hypothetical protein [Caudoviricetes sp.]